MIPSHSFIIFGFYHYEPSHQYLCRQNGSITGLISKYYRTNEFRQKLEWITFLQTFYSRLLTENDRKGAKQAKTADEVNLDQILQSSFTKFLQSILGEKFGLPNKISQTQGVNTRSDISALGP